MAFIIFILYSFNLDYLSQIYIFYTNMQILVASSLFKLFLLRKLFNVYIEITVVIIIRYVFPIS